MGLIEQVIEKLNAAGLRAEESYPGRPIPYLQGVAAAVSLEEADLAEKTATVAVTVMAPAGMGGGACRAPAATAAQVLEALGGVWKQGPCALDGKGDFYQVKVSAVFSGEAAEAGWAGAPVGFTVQQENTVLTHAVRFTLTQQQDPESGLTLEASPITFEMEEQFAPGEPETALSSQNFVLRIRRPSSLEILHGCRWVGIRRTDTLTGLRQVRTGSAAGRSMANTIN